MIEEIKNKVPETASEEGKIRDHIRIEYARMAILVAVFLGAIAFYLVIQHNYEVNFVDTSGSSSSL